MLIVFDHILTAGLSPNEFYVLLALYNKQMPKLANLQLEVRRLEVEGYIQDRKITKKAISVVKEFVDKYKLEKDGKVARKVRFTEEQMKNIWTFREMFPKGTLPSGSPSRTPIKELEKKFMWFFLNYDYDWETVLKATRKYVAEYEANGFKYMKTSGYFISKVDKGITVSTLASYCDMIKDGDEEIVTTAVTHKVL